MDKTGARFQTTRWTLVDALRGDDEGARRDATDRLVRAYWPAVYGYLRRRGAGRDEAAEATQAFFVDVALGRELFARADPARGRLRTLILAALRNHQRDAARAVSARGAWAGPSPGSIEQVERALVATTGAPEEEFDRQWATAALNEALSRCRAHFEGGGKARHWRLFEARELTPAKRQIEALPLAALAAELGYRSAADAAAAVQTVKKRLLALLEEVVSESAGTEEDLREEMAWLRTAAR